MAIKLLRPVRENAGDEWAGCGVISQVFKIILFISFAVKNKANTTCYNVRKKYSKRVFFLNLLNFYRKMLTSPGFKLQCMYKLKL